MTDSAAGLRIVRGPHGDCDNPDSHYDDIGCWSVGITSRDLACPGCGDQPDIPMPCTHCGRRP